MAELLTYQEKSLSERLEKFEWDRMWIEASGLFTEVEKVILPANTRPEKTIKSRITVFFIWSFSLNYFDFTA